MTREPIRRRHRKKTRAKPYSRPGAGDDVDMTMRNLDVEREPTRGRILQRHKVECRNHKLKIAAMTKELKRLSKKTAGEKEERRQRTRSIRELDQEIIERHARQLKEFDDAALLDTEQQSGDMNDATTRDVLPAASDFTFNLPNITSPMQF